MSFEVVLWSLIFLTILMLVGKATVTLIPLLKKWFIPSSLVAGLIGLLIGKQGLGKFINLPEFTETIININTFRVWHDLPGHFISIVFAAIFLGHKIPPLREIWEIAAPQVAFGQAVAWGQYMVGLTLGLLILAPYFDVPAATGALIEIGFEGGHGTVAGLSKVFEEYEIENGRDIGMALATSGILMSVIVGLIIINIYDRNRKQTTKKNHVKNDNDDKIIPNKTLGEGDDLASDSLTLHLGIVGLAILIGYFLQQTLIFIEKVTWLKDGNGLQVFSHFPLFPLAMVGSVIIQKSFQYFNKENILSDVIMKHISGFSLDLIIISSVATLNLSIIYASWNVFLVLFFGGTFWTISAYFILAPRIMPKTYMMRGVSDVAQSLGMTVMGILMIKSIDKSSNSFTLKSFSYKQLLFEPIVGGGFFTAVSIPLTVAYGPITMIVCTSLICFLWIFIGIRFLSKKDRVHTD